MNHILIIMNFIRCITSMQDVNNGDIAYDNSLYLLIRFLVNLKLFKNKIYYLLKYSNKNLIAKENNGKSLKYKVYES